MVHQCVHLFCPLLCLSMIYLCLSMIYLPPYSERTVHMVLHQVSLFGDSLGATLLGKSCSHGPPHMAWWPPYWKRAVHMVLHTWLSGHLTGKELFTWSSTLGFVATLLGKSCSHGPQQVAWWPPYWERNVHKILHMWLDGHLTGKELIT